jgi:DNA replication protein DnaC
MVEETIESYLKCLEWEHLRTHWDHYLKDAVEKNCSYSQLLSTIITDEYLHRSERRRLARTKAAKIPQLLVMETFPFDRQVRLKKKMVMELYDSKRFITENQFLLFIGPTGCGKTGLGTSYLIHALNNEYRGRFIDFNDLIAMLNRSVADHSEKRVIKQLASIDCLLIDEVGYTTIDKNNAGLFFELMKQRHNKRCTIITSQLGFEEWGSFINDKHITAALLDRITENCTVFNMTKCISIRPKKIEYAAEKTKVE